MGVLRGIARAARSGWRRLRFGAWALHLRIELMRRGARLVLEAPRGALLDTWPVVRARMEGSGGATFVLRLGREVHFGRDVVLDIWACGDNVLELDDHARIGDGAHLYLRGGEIRMGPQTYTREWTVLKSEGVISLGARTEISYGCYVHCHERIELAENCGLADRVTLIDSDHTPDGSDEHYYHTPLLHSPILLRSNTLIGANCTVLRGAALGPNAVVAAGAVVRGGDYPAGWVIGGIPARALKPLRPAAADVAEPVSAERTPSSA